MVPLHYHPRHDWDAILADMNLTEINENAEACHTAAVLGDDPEMATLAAQACDMEASTRL